MAIRRRGHCQQPQKVPMAQARPLHCLQGRPDQSRVLGLRYPRGILKREPRQQHRAYNVRSPQGAAHCIQKQRHSYIQLSGTAGAEDVRSRAVQVRHVSSRQLPLGKQAPPATVYGTALFKQAGICDEFYAMRLRPWEHYIPVDYNLTNMTQSVVWARNNQGVVRRIIRNMQSYASRFNTAEFAIEYAHSLLSAYAEKLDYEVHKRWH